MSELRRNSNVSCYLMTFLKITDNEGIGVCTWWGRDIEIPTGKGKDMGMVAEAIVAQNAVSWIKSKGERKMISLLFHFQ